MISILSNDQEDMLLLPEVGDCLSAELAAKRLKKGLESAGEQARLLTPDHLDAYCWGVDWIDGPNQWADAYSVSPGSSSDIDMGCRFVCYVRDKGIVFENLT